MPPAKLSADELRRIKQEMIDRINREMAQELSLLHPASPDRDGAPNKKADEKRGSKKV